MRPKIIFELANIILLWLRFININDNFISKQFLLTFSAGLLRVTIHENPLSILFPLFEGAHISNIPLNIYTHAMLNIIA